MRLISFWLLFVCFNCSAKSLPLNDWIAYFNKQDIQIVYSSDFLKTDALNTRLTVENSITSFTSALHPLALTLIKVDESTYVINPIEAIAQHTTGLIIRLVDIDNKPINSFSINKISTSSGLVLLNNIEAQSLPLTIKASGYKAIKKSANVTKGIYTPVTLMLEQLPLSLDKVIVTASQVNFKAPNASQQTLLREDIENTVSLGNDPVRATKRIPGNTSSGISGKTRTRGGNENESLIVLDNHILRNPFHFQNFYSLFSTINLSTIDGLDFYSGIFPIKYGGRLSSVLDVQTSDNYNQPTHEFGIDLINSYYNYRHNSDDYKQQYLASIRTGGKFINEHFIKNSIIQPEFDDAYFKSTQEINDNWNTSQHLLLSRDEIVINDSDEALESIETANAGHHDQDLWTQINYNNHKNIYASLQLYLTRKHNNRNGSVTNETTIASLSEDVLTKNYGLKFNQTFNIRENISMNFGFDVHQENTLINRERSLDHFGELVNQLGLQRQSQQHYIFENRGLGIDTYFNTRYQFSDKLIFDLGLRFEKKQWIEENVTSPRFNMSYFRNDSTTYRFALGRHQQSQYIDEFLLEDETPEYFDPTSAEIAVLELEKQISPKLNVRTEVYYKKYSSTQPYYENLFNGLHILPDLFYDRIRVSPDDSKAMGAEFTLNGNNELLDWSASYIFSDVDDLIEGIDIPRSWDQHHALKINIHMPINLKYINKWHIDLSANYHTGWAKTEIVENADNVAVGLRNESTFDDYYQFDVKLNKHIKTAKGQLNFAIQVNNLFNTKNSCCRNYTLENDNLQSDEKYWLSILPNFSFVYLWN